MQAIDDPFLRVMRRYFKAIHRNGFQHLSPEHLGQRFMVKEVFALLYPPKTRAHIYGDSRQNDMDVWMKVQLSRMRVQNGYDSGYATKFPVIKKEKI